MSGIHSVSGNNIGGNVNGGNNSGGGGNAMMNFCSQSQHNVPGTGGHQYVNGGGPPGVMPSGTGGIAANHNSNNSGSVVGGGVGNGIIAGGSVGNPANVGLTATNGISVVGGGGNNNVNNIGGNVGAATSASGLNPTSLGANALTAVGIQMNSMGTIGGGGNGAAAQTNGVMTAYNNNGMTNAAAAAAAVAVAASARHHPVSINEVDSFSFSFFWNRHLDDKLPGTFSTAPKYW